MHHPLQGNRPRIKRRELSHVPSNRLSVEMAIQDFGGSVLGRPIETLQADDQNKPDIAREWLDSSSHFG